MDKSLVISLSPHVKGDVSVNKIMWGVVIALVPAFASAVYYFGFNALRVVILSVIFCIGVEFLIQKFVLKTRISALDGSAAVTGVLLAFNLPSNIPWWQLLAGAVMAIGVSKMAFGGLGKNPFNPALVGRAFMLASFPVHMTSWPVPGDRIWDIGVDAVSAATPLGKLAEQGPGGITANWDLFLGNVGGSIGETSVVAILIGAGYLLIKRYINWHIPVFYLLSLAGFTAIFWLFDPGKYADPLFHLLAGGVMLGAWFMATDMVTSPMAVRGQIVFAVAAGILCGAIRIFGSYPEGCSYSILIMNAFVPIIDTYFKPQRFGREASRD